MEFDCNVLVIVIEFVNQTLGRGDNLCNTVEIK